MASYNKVMIIGNLVDAPRKAALRSGGSVIDIRLAVNRKTQNGDDVCYVDVTAFGQTGEVIERYVGKGDPLFVDGRLTMEQWTDKETGRQRSRLKVIAETIQLIGGRRDDSGGVSNPQRDYGQPPQQQGYYNGYQQQQPPPQYQQPPQQGYYQPQQQGGYGQVVPPAGVKSDYPPLPPDGPVQQTLPMPPPAQPKADMSDVPPQVEDDTPF